MADWVSPSTKKITELNDDCLRILFDLLPLNEVLHLRIVCRRFRDIIKLRCENTTSLKLFSDNEFLSEYGTLLKRLNCEKTEDATSADNVLTLVNGPQLLSSLSNCPNLFPKAKTLVLDCCYGGFTTYLLSLWHLNLTTLSVGCFNGLKKDRDDKLWKSLVPFRALTNLSCVGDNSPEVSSDMKNVLKRLKTFIIDRCTIEWLYHLGPSLERLHIYNGENNSLHGWKKLLEDEDALPNRHQMTHLQIAGDCSKNSRENVVHLISNLIVDNFHAITHLDISLLMRKSYSLPWSQLLVVFGQLHRLTHLTLHDNDLLDLHTNVFIEKINFQSIPQVTTLRLTNINWDQETIENPKNICETLSSVFVNLKNLTTLTTQKTQYEDLFVEFVAYARTKWDVENDYLKLYSQLQTLSK